jgi:hypothetical protein
MLCPFFTSRSANQVVQQLHGPSFVPPGQRDDAQIITEAGSWGHIGCHDYWEARIKSGKLLQSLQEGLGTNTSTKTIWTVQPDTAVLRIASPRLTSLAAALSLDRITSALSKITRRDTPSFFTELVQQQVPIALLGSRHAGAVSCFNLTIYCPAT